MATQDGVDASMNQSRRLSNLKNRVDEATKDAAIKYAMNHPVYEQVRASDELRLW